MQNCYLYIKQPETLLGTRHCVGQVAAEKAGIYLKANVANSGLLSSSTQTRLSAECNVYMWKEVLEAYYTYCCP